MKPALTRERFERALASCADLFELPIPELRTSRRPRPTSARLALYAALYQTYDTTLVQLGELLNRNHTTVAHGIRIAAQRAERDADYAAAVDLVAAASH